LVKERTESLELAGEKTEKSWTPLPFERDIRTFLIYGTVFLIALVALTRYMQKLYRFNFFTEGTFFTWFSSTILLAAAFAAFTGAYLISAADRSPERKRHTWGWIGMGLFGFLLAVDDWFEIHETIAPYSGQLLEALNIHVKDSYWDLPYFALYGLMALGFWWLIKADISRSRSAKNYLFIGVGLEAIGIFLDTWGSGKFLVMWEDSFKIIGFFFILAAFLTSLLHKINDLHLGQAPEAEE
jgi:hypothetical protein